MDLKREFQDLNLNDDGSHEIVKDLESRLAKIKQDENSKVVVDENGNEVIYEEVEQEQTFLEKIQPFILPIALTIFAIIFAGMFLYFFSKSRVESTAQAIINQGVPEPVINEPVPIPVVIKEEPLKCTEPQILNEAKDACIDPEPEPQPEPEPVKAEFENGTTTEVNVQFSYDKFNYDNSPRGIYLLTDQIFNGDYKNFKISPNNRSYTNDYFFGIDRYTVSLIGSCSYVVDNAKILVEDMRLEDKKFTGKVAKIIESGKPRIDCGKSGVGYNTQNGDQTGD